jgi:hypothetical protein
MRNVPRAFVVWMLEVKGVYAEKEETRKR